MPRTKKPTTQTRISEDLGVIMSALSHVDGLSSAERIDPLVRPSVEAQFRSLPVSVRTAALASVGYMEDPSVAAVEVTVPRNRFAAP